MSIVGKSSQNARFSLQDMPGLTLWLDGADSNTLTLSGSNVIQWRDKSGLGNHSVGTSNSPTWSPTLINNRPGISFSNTGMWGAFTSTLSSPDVHVFLVLNRLPKSGDAYTRFFLLDDGISNGYNTTTGGGFMNNGFDEIAWQRNGVRGRGQPLSGAVSLINAPNVGGKQSISKNGGAFLDVSNNAASGFATTAWRIGVDGTGNNLDWATNFYIGEILVFNSVLSRPQYQSVESYLALKWGLSTYPRDIPGCAFWLDAADRATLTISSSNTVTGWTDKSGANQTVSVVSPGTYSPTAMNGRPAVAFAAGNYMTSTTASTFGSNFTTFVVFTSTSTGYSFVLAMGSATTPLYMWYRGDFGTYQLSAEGAGGIGNNLYTTANVPMIMTGDVRSTSPYWTLYLNGTSVVDPRIGGGGTAPLANLGGSNVYIPGQYVGFGGPTGGGFAGHISEVILYSNALTTTQRLAVQGYLSTKWGLAVPSKPQFLPTTHPFPSAPPATRPFSPLDVDGMVQWMDAADYATLTFTGSNVTAWADKSGNGNHLLQNGASNVPTYGASLVASRPALDFTGGAGLRTAGGVLNSANVTVFIVAMMKPTTTAWGTVWGHFEVNRHDYDIQLRRTESSSNINWHTNNDNSVVQLQVGPDVPVVFSCTMRNGTEMMMQRVLPTQTNVVSATVGSTISIQSVPIWVGRSGYNESINGYISEILYYSNVLTTVQRGQIEGYLADKWGFRGVMGGLTHPSKYIPPSFTPTQLSGCSLWLDAADSNAMTLSGSNVVQWRDKSSNAYAGTAVGNPVRTTIDGYSAVTFNGSSQYIDFGDVADIGTAALNIFTVAKFNTTGNGTLIAKSLQGSGANRWAMLRENGAFNAFVGGDSGGVSSSYTDANTTRRMLAYTWDRATYTLYQNGTSVATSNYANTSTITTSNKLLIGAYNNNVGGTPPASGLYLNGSINEVVCVFGTMTASERQQMEGYLAWKWGLTAALPGSITPWTNRNRGLTPIFAPNQIAGLTLWLDGADRGTQTFSGSNLAQWVDKSGSGYTMDTVAPNCSLPVRGTAINGLSTIGITSGSMGIKQSNVINGVKTIFWVRREVGGNQGYQFYLGSDGAADFHTGDSGEFAHSGIAPQGVRDAQLSLFRTGGVTTGTLSSVVFPHPSNGPLTMVSISNLSGDTRIQGISYDRGNTGRSITCDWGELLLYTSTVSLSERNRIEGYLAWKWGLASLLPSTHPYKTFKP